MGSPHWRPEVKLCSALEEDGVGQVQAEVGGNIPER